MELALLVFGFAPDERMQLATELKGADEPAAANISAQSKTDSAEVLVHENCQPSTAILPPQSVQYFALVAQATNDAVRIWDVKTGILSWPQGLETLLGYAPNPAQNRISFWEEKIHPEDRARAATNIAEALRGASEHWSGEYRFRRADGSYAHLIERALIVRDSKHTAQQFVGSLMDITARKQLQDQLLRSQKMEAFGQLAGGVAHDFNNFLTAILGYSDLALDTLGAKSNAASHIVEIREAAGRASTLTGQLLAFSRKHPLAPRIVEVNSVISNMERSLLRLLGENVSVVCHLHREEQGAHIRVDPSQLTQVLLNLAVNARDAMRGGGQLTLETSSVTIEPITETEIALEEPGPGDYVLISVTDNGIGMDEETKAHLFEPFFSTKDEGSGLGLATSYGIIRQSGGSIQIESELNKGTTVRIYLPKVDPPARTYRKRNGKMPTGTETILVLEDDVSVRHISVRVLRSLGYEVIEAANGDDAQRLIAQQGTRKIHLLLTDMVMPQMSGRNFADWLRSTSPETRVIFVSGYLEESLRPDDRRDPGMFFLPKPFNSEQLASKVREVLDQSPLVRL
jgi:two-component system cell cycle sensor histidine kinase/response regulator CckA